MSKTSIKERNKAIRLAWEREQKLVAEGKEHGTGRRISKRTSLILIKEKSTTKMDAHMKAST